MVVRLHFVLALLAGWLGLATGGVARARPIRVGLEPHAEPLTFVDTSGQAAGFAVDIVRESCRAEGLEPEFVVKPWGEVLDDLRNHRLDALANVAYTAERATYIDFSVAHIDMQSAVFYGPAKTAPARVEDLATRRIAVSLRSLGHDFVVAHGWSDRMIDYPTLDAALMAIDRGECDVALATRLIGSQIARDLHLAHVRAADFDVAGLDYELHMGVHSGDTALLYQLNNGLARIRADGTYDRLHEKWIGPLEPRRIAFNDIRPYLPPVAVLALAVVGAFVWQRQLLRRLAAQREQLRLSEERLMLVMEGSEDGFWDWDLRARHVLRSERWAGMLGYTVAEIGATPDAADKLVHPNDRAIYYTCQDQLNSGQIDRYNIEYRMRAKSGEWRWVLDRGKVVSRDTTGRPLRMAGTHTDITARKATEAQLIESETLLKRSAQLLEQTQAAARIGGWEIDLRTGRVYWSHETYIIHEITPEEFHPDVDNVLRFYSAASRPLIAAALDNATRYGTAYELELDITTAQHRTIHVQTTGRAERDGDRIVKIFGSIRDVTAERNADEEREKLRLKMLEAQKLESLGVLAGGIAHDFNNLLTVILANAGMARNGGPAGEEKLAHIEAAASRAADLCRQMLAYAGRGSFVVEKLDLSMLVQDTARLLQVSISKKARLTLSLAGDVPTVEADASQLRQVVMNLVINASEALGENAGDIRISTRRSRPDPAPGSVVHSFNLPDGDCACVEVADTGQGMPPATLARVFDPFFTTKFAGRGLGLAAVLGIVRAHRGALTVTSAAGQGSTFCLYLPGLNRHDPAPARPPAAVPPAIDPASIGAILLADDEPVVLATADALLRYFGYKTVLAADGNEAVKQFRANPEGFAAVVLDLTMPGLDGAEALRIIRTINPQVRALIMSGYSEQDILARLRGQGRVPILHKPFSKDGLLSRIAEVIANESQAQG